MNNIYFFDTYALVEIIKGNHNYDRVKESRVILTIFNLVELHYAILRDFDKKTAGYILEKYSKYAINIDLDLIKESNEFKLKNRKKKLSIPDAVGYIFSVRNGIKFLTGDKAFENMPNVEFVK